MGLKNGKITADIDVKSTDRHKYLYISSAHPNHTKRSVVFIRTFRIGRLFSNGSDFEQNKDKIRSWFEKRKYLEKLMDSEKRKFNIKETNRKKIK